MIFLRFFVQWLNKLVKPNDIPTNKPNSKHIGVSLLTEKCEKNNSQTSAVHDHMLFCKTVVCPEDFSILAKSSEHASSSKYVRVLTMLLLLNMLVFWLYLSWNIWKFRFLKCEEFFPGFRSLKYKKNFWVFLEKI